MAANSKQREILKTLTSHSLLFVGPSAVGRKATAAWYAKWLNCQNPKDDACGYCTSCRQFENNEHPDFMVIKPETTTASGKISRNPEIKISQMVKRKKDDGSDLPLSQWLESRVVFNYKVAVIVSAHNLTVSAANSFLKFLEEPPGKAKIVLIAPSAQSLLPTIASRTTIVRFSTSEFPDKNHPLARLGRIGDYEQSRNKQQAFDKLNYFLDDYLINLSGSLSTVLASSAGLEKIWLEEDSFDLSELLLAKISKTYPNYYYQSSKALDNYQDSLARYGSSTIATQLLSLELRQIFSS